MRPRYVVKKAEISTEQDAENENALQDASERVPSQAGIRSRHNEQQEKPSSEDYPREEPSIPSEGITRTAEREVEGNSHSHVSRAVQAVDTDRGEADKGKSFAVSAIYVSIRSPSRHTLSRPHISQDALSVFFNIPPE